MIPTSRGGQTDEFNLFPFQIKRHNCWHKIFLNMTIWEAWECLDEAYGAIFNSGMLINRHWLFVCELPSKNDLDRQIEKEYNREDLIDAWFCAFGGRKLSRAKKFVKYMMLFMIFGSDMACPRKLFNSNDKLSAFFKEFPLTGERELAFSACFGARASLEDIKPQKIKILNNLP